MVITQEKSYLKSLIVEGMEIKQQKWRTGPTLKWYEIHEFWEPRKPLTGFFIELLGGVKLRTKMKIHDCLEFAICRGVHRFQYPEEDYPQKVEM